jgi:hypothetical protein
VVVPAGAQSVTFSIPTTVQYDNTVSVGIVAAAAGWTRAAMLQILPKPLPFVPTLFSFISSLGDGIGQGQSVNYSPSNASFSAKSGCDGDVVEVVVSTSLANTWRAQFAAPKGSKIRPGSYVNATRYPFQAANTPGLSISGAGRGCNQSFGAFTVFQAEIEATGTVRRFRATFEQHCEQPTAPPLTGEVGVSDPPGQSTTFFCK